MDDSDESITEHFEDAYSTLPQVAGAATGAGLKVDDKDDRSIIDAHREFLQQGQHTHGQEVPGRSDNRGVPGQGHPGNIDFPGQGHPGNRGIPGQGHPGNRGVTGQGHPDIRGVTGQGHPGNKGVTGQGHPYSRGVTGQGHPGNRGVTGQGHPVNKGVTGQGHPGNRGVTGQGHPDNRGVTGQGHPDNGCVTGQGHPDNRGIPGQGHPDNRWVPGQGHPGNRGVTGQCYPDNRGVPGQGHLDNRGVPGQGHPDNRGVPGQGHLDNRSLTGQGHPDNRGLTGQGHPDNRCVTGQGHPDSRGVPGQGHPDNRCVTGQGHPDFKGVPWQGHQDSRDVPGEPEMEGASGYQPHWSYHPHHLNHGIEHQENQPWQYQHNIEFSPRHQYHYKQKQELYDNHQPPQQSPTRNPQDKFDLSHSEGRWLSETTNPTDLPEETHTIEVRGFSSLMELETLELYFENKKRSQGGEIKSKVIRKGNVYITFEESGVAQRVASKTDHVVNDIKLTVNLHQQPPPNTIAVKSQTNKDTIVMYFESRSSSGGGDCTIKEENGFLYFTFEDSAVFERVLQRFPHKLGGKTLQVSRAGKEDFGEEDEREITISATLEVRGYDPQTSLESIEFYFENKNRSGGEGDVSVKEDKTKGAIYVTFESNEIAGRVLKRNHKLDGKKLTVTLSRPQVMYKDKMLVTGVPEDVSKESLVNYLENVTRIDVDNDSVLYGEDDEVLVSFVEDLNDFSVIVDKMQTKPFKHEGRRIDLEVSQVFLTTCIRVNDLPTNASEDNLYDYFENKKSGGCVGEIKDVVMNHQDRFAVVEFVTPEVASAVAKRKHVICKTTVPVSLHFECLGESGGSPDPKPTKLPPSLELDLDLHKLKHVSDTEKVSENLQACFESTPANFTIDVETSKLILFPDFSLESRGGLMLVKTWSKTAKERCVSFFEKIDIEKLRVDPDVWSDSDEITTRIQEDGISIFRHDEKKTIVLVGPRNNIQRLKGNLQVELKSLKEQYERQKNTVTEKHCFNIDKLRLLQSEGFLDSIKFNDLQVDVVEPGTLSFTGKSDDIQQARIELLQRLANITSTVSRDFSKEEVELLKHKGVTKYLVTKWNQSSNKAVWETGQDGVVIVYSHQDDYDAVLQFLKNSFKQTVVHLDPDNSPIFRSIDLQTVIDSSSRDYEGKVVITVEPTEMRIVITGLEQDVPSAAAGIREFVDRNNIYTQQYTFVHGVAPRQDHPGFGVVPGQDHSDRGVPGQGHPDNSGVPGQGHPDDKSVPGQGHSDNRWVPGHGHPNNNGVPGQGHPENSGAPGQGHSDKTAVPGQGHPDNRGVPGQCHPDNSGVPGQGHPDNRGVPGQSHPNFGGVPQKSQPGFGQAPGQDYPNNGGNQGGYGYQHGDPYLHAYQQENTQMKPQWPYHPQQFNWQYQQNFRFPPQQQHHYNQQHASNQYYYQQQQFQQQQQHQPRTTNPQDKSDQPHGGEQRQRSSEKDNLKEVTEETHVIEVRGFSPSMKLETLELYFESMKHSQGGEIKSKVIRKGSAYITFEQSGVAQRVASKTDHVLNDTKLTVKLHQQPPPNTIAVKSQTNKDTIEMYFESKSKSGGGDCTIKEENGFLFFTFEDSAVFERVLQRCPHKLSGKTLQVSKAGEEELGEEDEDEITPSTTLEVRGYDIKSSLESISLYFENKRKSGGGGEVAIKQDKKKGVIYVTFERNEIAERVLKRGHKHEGKELTVTLSRPQVMYKEKMSLVPGYSDNETLRRSTVLRTEPEKPRSAIAHMPRPRIILVKADMGVEEADVIVNSSNPELDLSKGQVSKAIRKNAGDAIQKECKEKYPRGIKMGDIAVTKGGNLLCVEQIYHCTLPQWRDDTGKATFRKTMSKLLNKANDSKWKTIAIPALGTGTLGYSNSCC